MDSFYVLHLLLLVLALPRKHTLTHTPSVVHRCYDTVSSKISHMHTHTPPSLLDQNHPVMHVLSFLLALLFLVCLLLTIGRAACFLDRGSDSSKEVPMYRQGAVYTRKH